MRRVWTLAGAGGTCVAVAFCAAAFGGVGEKTVTVPQIAVVSATAKCPAGQRATGGGWESTPSVSSDVQVYPMESRKVGQRRWRVTGAQNSPNPNVDATMRAIVYGSADAPRTVTKTRTADVPSDSLSYGDANARCGTAGRVQ